MTDLAVLSRDLTRQLVTVGPHRGAHRVALRAGLAVAAPLLVLLALDRLEWSIYATFGAFTVIYGARLEPASRLRVQALAGSGLVAAVVLGALVGAAPGREWLAVVGVAAVATTASVVVDLRGWTPPGTIFYVFGFAAVASVPATVSAVGVAAVVAALSALGAAGVGVLDALARRQSLAGPAGAVPARPEGVRRHALRAGVAVGLAAALATAAGIGHPYWAAVAAVVPLAARDLHAQLLRGVQRVVGTAAGLGLAGLLLWLEPTGLVLVLLVVALQVGAELWVGRNYAIALVMITPLALLMVHLASPIPLEQLLGDRAVETVLGVAVGLTVGWATRRRPA